MEYVYATASSVSAMGTHGRPRARGLWTESVPRVVLGLIFAVAALNYFWQEAFGWPLVPLQITVRGEQFVVEIIKVGYLWPLMKAINLAAGILLIANRAPPFALALLAPVTVIIIWFQVFLNPLPIPLVTVAVVALCELLLLRAYASSYAGMFKNGVNSICSYRDP
jgi:putative oxidoreductase